MALTFALTSVVALVVTLAPIRPDGGVPPTAPANAPTPAPERAASSDAKESEAPAPPVEPASLTTPEIAKRAASAVVLLRTFSDDGSELALGSGFFIDGNRVVTNAHVVSGAARVEVYGNDGNLIGLTDYAESMSQSVDLAILPPFPGTFTTLPVRREAATVGEDLIVIGAPQGLSSTITTGILSAVRSGDGRTLLQMSAPISHGSSGGPVLNRRAEVVGVAVSMNAEGQNLNFAVPARDVLALAESPRGRFKFTARGTVSREPAHPSGEPAEQPSIRDAIANSPAMGVNDIKKSQFTDQDAVLKTGERATMFSANLARGEPYVVVVASNEFQPEVQALEFDEHGQEQVIGIDHREVTQDHIAISIRPRYGGLTGVFVTTKVPKAKGAFAVAVFTPEQVAPRAPQSDRWVRITRAADMTYELDTQSLRESADGTVRFWVRETGSKKRDASGNHYDHVFSLNECDCLAHTFRIISSTEYLGSKAVKSFDMPSSWAAVIPETIGEEIESAACARAPRSRAGR